MVFDGSPSGKLVHNYGKSPCLMGKSTISIYLSSLQNRNIAPDNDLGALGDLEFIHQRSLHDATSKTSKQREHFP